MPKARHWAFTIQRGNLLGKISTLDDWFTEAQHFTREVKYLVYQMEVAPNTGTEHIQGFVSFTTQKRESTLANHFGKVHAACFQVMLKNATPWDNKLYCTKEASRKPGTVPFEYGQIPTGAKEAEQADKSKLCQFIDIMRDQSMSKAIELMPDTFVRNCNGLEKLNGIYQGDKIPQIREVTVYVACGDSGAGKSWWANTFDTRENTFSVPDIRHKERLNIDGYQGQRTLLIEDYDGAIEFRSLLKMLDIYKSQFNTKGSMAWGAWDTVIITTNVHASRWYDDRVDPWGLADKSPLKRRIHFMLEFTGMWPNAMVSVNGDPPTPTSWLHDRAATEAARADGAEPADGGASTSPAVPAVPVPSNPAVAPNKSDAWKNSDGEDDMLEHQIQDLDFLKDLSPFNFEGGEDADAYLNGLDGDTEPKNSRDLFGFY